MAASRELQDASAFALFKPPRLNYTRGFIGAYTLGGCARCHV